MKQSNSSFDKLSGATTTALHDYLLHVYGLGPLLKVYLFKKYNFDSKIRPLLYF